MKFREFVGEQKVKEVKKKIVDTHIGKMEKDFLRNVARENPDGSRRSYYSDIETHFGFGLSKKNLKRVFDYIRSWLIRYDVSFKAINPYLTLYVLNNLPSILPLIKNVKENKINVIYKPSNTITVISNKERDFPRAYNIEPDRNKDYILLDYEINKEYKNTLEEIFNSMDIDIIFKQCYVKLFEIESGILKHRDYEDIMYSCPRFPHLKIGNIGIRRTR